MIKLSLIMNGIILLVLFFFTFDFLFIKIIKLYIFLIKKNIYKIININNYKFNNIFAY